MRGLSAVLVSRPTDMVAALPGIYDAGGNCIPLGNSGLYVQTFEKADPAVIAYIKENAAGYSWMSEAETGFSKIFPNSGLGVGLDSSQIYSVFSGCVACAAGLSYGFPLDLRSEQQLQQDQRAFTLGFSSLIGAPFAMPMVYSYGAGAVATGAGLGAGFDVVV